MGQSRQRLAKLRAQTCICGSGMRAGECCHTGQYWHKRLAELNFRRVGATSVVDGCYMKQLGTCRGGISGEHLISESVVLLLAGDGEFSIAGTPWLSEGESKVIGIKALTANCLCQQHNSDLHPLDDAALLFFTSLKSSLEGATGVTDYLVSGHDIERWLLKSLKAMAVSHNLGIGRKKLAGDFASDVRVLEMLENVKAWPMGTGLYCLMRVGQMTQNHNRFQIAPITNAGGEICALWTNVLGISFLLVLEQGCLNGIPALAQAVFRPARLIVQHPPSSHSVILSWDDGIRHRGDMTLKWVSDVPR
jgi:hypothetical protein